MVIMEEARPHAKGPTIHRRSVYSGDSSKSFAIPTPMSAEIPWPRIEARGWARGEATVL